MRIQRGFNLIEAAIVLGIVGLVIGGIWIASAAVQSNLRKAEGVEGLIQIVQNVRSLFANQGPAVNNDITAQLINARAIPADYVSGTVARNPWNGSVVVGLSGPGPADKIDVTYSTMPRDVCVELTARNTGVAVAAGLTQIVIDDGSPVTVTTFPYSPAQASTDCGASNTVIWTFNLR